MYTAGAERSQMSGEKRIGKQIKFVVIVIVVNLVSSSKLKVMKIE
jgi:hypothetical protein